MPPDQRADCSEVRGRCIKYQPLMMLSSSSWVLCKTLNPMVLQRFFKSIIDKVGIVDGKVCWIRFRNGITHKFMY